jgi:myo-inositol-1(or 4)-monophosphatase
MAAGTLLVEEAGGRVSGMRGEALDLDGRYVLADNALVHDELLDLFAEIFAGRYRHEMPGLPTSEWELHRG